MRKIAALLFVAAAACGGGMSNAQADKEVKQLITLYQEARPKFVVQKQSLEQGDCARANALRKSIDRMAAQAAMSPDDTSTITKVQMELVQAEKTCNGG